MKQGIETGAVSDRATMVSALQRAGLEVPRQGKDYLTAADPQRGGKWRLKAAALKAWTRPIVVGLLIFLGIYVARAGA